MKRHKSTEDGDLNLIRRTFADYFKGDGLELPTSLETDKNYTLDDYAWTVHFLLKKTGNSYYLDFYCYHRMTNSRHHRIWTDGRLESLENYWEFGYVVYENDPERTERERKEKIDENQKVSEILKAKGFES